MQDSILALHVPPEHRSGSKPWELLNVVPNPTPAKLYVLNVRRTIINMIS